MNEVSFINWNETVRSRDTTYIRVVILTITPEERASVRKIFDFSHRISGSEFSVMEIAELTTSRGTKIELIHASEIVERQGRIFGSEVFDRIADHLKPDFLLLVGIAGGVPNSLFTLGDVVIPSAIIDVTTSKARVGSNSPKYTTFLWEDISEGSNVALEACGRLGETNPLLDGWHSELLGDARPELVLSQDIEQHCSQWYMDKLSSTLQSRCPKGFAEALPRYGIGELISADVNNKDPDLTEKWMKAHEDVVGNEMELGGFLACIKARKKQKKPVPNLLAFKAISDIPGYDKPRNNVEYACLSSASLAKSMVIVSGIFDPPDSVPLQSWTSPLPDHVLRYEKLPDETFLEVLGQYSSIFCEMTEGNSYFKGTTENGFADIWADILEKSDLSRPLSIEGPPGTGKTTFLALLALFASKFHPEDAHIDYVNLHELDELKPTSNLSEYVQDAEKKLTDWVKKLESKSKEKEVYVFTDGFDDYLRERILGIRATFEQQIGSFKAIHIVGIGRLTGLERGRRKTAHVPDASALITLCPIHVRSAKTLCDSFSSLNPHFPDDFLRFGMRFAPDPLKQGYSAKSCHGDRGTQWVTRKRTICGSVLTAA